MSYRHVIIDQFDSYDAFLAQAADQSRAKWAAGDRSSITGEEQFTQTRSFDHAVEIARTGWTEGRTRMVYGLERASLLASTAGRPAVTMDVAGAYPVVPLAIAGDPACMVDVGDIITAARPIVRLLVPLGYSASVQPFEVENHGIALLSVIDAMENDGHSIELEGAVVTRKAEMLYVIRIMLKRAGEPLDLDRLAFALAHPSLVRRLCFALFEQHTEHDFYHVFKSSYGSPCRLPESMVDPGVNYLPGIDWLHTEPWRDIRTAVAHMETLIRPGIAEVEDRDGAA